MKILKILDFSDFQNFWKSENFEFFDFLYLIKMPLEFVLRTIIAWFFFYWLSPLFGVSEKLVFSYRVCLYNVHVYNIHMRKICFPLKNLILYQYIQFMPHIAHITHIHENINKKSCKKNNFFLVHFRYLKRQMSLAMFNRVTKRHQFLSIF